MTGWDWSSGGLRCASSRSAAVRGGGTAKLDLVTPGTATHCSDVPGDHSLPRVVGLLAGMRATITRTPWPSAANLSYGNAAEYTAYQNSAHARVACVQCHIGPGAEWYVKSKINGAYQVYSVMFEKYSRPIPLLSATFARPRISANSVTGRPSSGRATRLAGPFLGG